MLSKGNNEIITEDELRRLCRINKLDEEKVIARFKEKNFAGIEIIWNKE